MDTTENEKITCRQMCETIVEADFLVMEDGSKPTAMQIFNYSPTGSLMNVFIWYGMAKEILEERNSTHKEDKT